MIAQARADGVPEAWLKAAKESPVYKMAVDWKVALPLHPEYRTLPMVWYVPPLSPIQAAANSGQIGSFGELPDLRSLRIPLKYLANLLTAGDEAPVVAALERMLAMRAYMRDRHVEQRENAAVLQQVGLTRAQVEDMYRYMAIANYEDRFVDSDDAPRVRRGRLRAARRLRLQLQRGLRLDRDGQEPVRRQRRAQGDPAQGRPLRRTTMQTTFRALSALLSYPTPDLVAALPEIRAIVAADRRLPRRDAAALDALCATLAAADPFDAQERYVDTFDRGRATSLNLFEHVHGDSRDRGTAMLDLKGVYERAGYAFVGNELPDYVPAVLEFLGTQPHAAAEELLGECAHILRRIGEALAERDSPYAAVFAALLAAVGADGLAPPKAAPRVAQAGEVDRRGVGGGAGDLRPRRRAVVRRRRPRVVRHPVHAAAGRAALKESSMSSWLNEFLFGMYPYIALTVFFVGSLARFDTGQYTWKSDSSQLLSRRRLRLGSNLFHIGILGIFGGHLVGLLTPLTVWHALGVSAGGQADARHRRRRHLRPADAGRARAADRAAAVRAADPGDDADDGLGRAVAADRAAAARASPRCRCRGSTASGEEMLKFMAWAQHIVTFQRRRRKLRRRRLAGVQAAPACWA